MKTYESHPIANLFPMMSKEELKTLADDIKANGQQETIILHEDKVLDGRNRQAACVIAGIEPRYGGFAAMGASIRKAGPLIFVISRNLHRRHLTVSQRADIAADLIPAFKKAEEDAAAEAAKILAPKGATTATNGTTAPKEEKPTKSKGGKAAAKAAKVMGVSPRSVERAIETKKKSPKKAEAVKAGKMTVGKATRNISKEAEAKLVKQVAIGQIEKVCGKKTANTARGLKAKELLDLSKMKDADMKRIGSLLDAGWTLTAAKNFRAKDVKLTSKVEELLDRADAEGGEFHFDIEGYKIDIERK